MPRRDELTKVAAECVRCERVFAARKCPEGTIRIIGRPGGCSCGGTTFRDH